jgi:hypothetical protein
MPLLVQVKEVGLPTPMAWRKSDSPMASGIGLLPQRLTACRACATSGFSGATGRSFQLGSSVLTITSPCSSIMTPMPALVSRSCSLSTGRWMPTGLVLTLTTPTTLPAALRIGTEMNTD